MDEVSTIDQAAYNSPYAGESEYVDEPYLGGPSYAGEPAYIGESAYFDRKSWEPALHGPGCGDAVCNTGSCETCPRRPQFYGSAEYLLWWTRESSLPPLATTSPDGTDQAEAGVLGLDTTDVLFGDGDFLDGARSGVRITLGSAFDNTRQNGLEFTYTLLEDESESFSASADDFAILARPFFNVDANIEDARLLTFPGLLDGSLRIDATTEFQSGEVLYRKAHRTAQCTLLDLYIGYRVADLDDDIEIEDSALSLDGATAGTTFQVTDEFITHNEYHGGVIGFAARRQLGCRWAFDYNVKLGLGRTSRSARAAGSTTVSAPGATPTTTDVGLLALPSNIGTFSDDELSTVSELGGRLHCCMTKSTTLTFGYSLLYWSDVWRAGEQIDLGVNPTQIPPGPLVGEARPEFPFVSSDFLAVGLSAGLESRF